MEYCVECQPGHKSCSTCVFFFEDCCPDCIRDGGEKDDYKRGHKCHNCNKSLRRNGGKKMNYIKQVAEMLGVELEEEFEIKGYYKKLIINKEGVYVYYINSITGNEIRELNNDLLVDLITGHFKITKPPKFPQDGTNHYFISADGKIKWSTFEEKSIIDRLNFKIGNYFLTKEEITEEDIERIVAMLNSPERLV